MPAWHGQHLVWFQFVVEANGTMAVIIFVSVFDPFVVVAIAVVSLVSSAALDFFGAAEENSCLFDFFVGVGGVGIEEAVFGPFVVAEEGLCCRGRYGEDV